jgi:molybdopterin molybdotransferase
MTQPPQLLSVTEARARLLEHFQPLPAERLSLPAAAGRVLAEAVAAAHDIPPFANSSMDGYAVRLADVAGATRQKPAALPVSGDIPAGSGMPAPLGPGTAVRIMTGAPIPAGAEAVVPVEDTDDRRDNTGAPPATIRIFSAGASGANVRPIGQDVRAGQTVLQAGTRLGPPAIGVLAALGRAQVNVHRRPLVAVVSTGDELVSVEQTPGPGQIRDTNGYAVPAAVERYGGVALRLGIARDRADEVRAKLLAAVEAGADLILSTAGVSVGAYDVVKAVVEQEGEIDFWRVRMRPGKPVAFGRVRAVPFIGLPGNPVSALVSFEVFARPAILKMGGQRAWEKPTVSATLTESLTSDGRESYLRVVLERGGDGYTARSAGDQGSAVLSALVRANGLLIVPEGVTAVRAGEKLSAWVLEE